MVVSERMVTTMTSDEARAILNQARETLEQTADIKVERREYREQWQRPGSEPEPVQRKLTDAVSARLMTEIDRRIAAAKAEVEQTIGEHRAATAEWIRASAQAIVLERKHRDEHDLRISALLAEVEKMQRGLDAKVIDLPALPLKGQRHG